MRAYEVNIIQFVYIYKYIEKCDVMKIRVVLLAPLNLYTRLNAAIEDTELFKITSSRTKFFSNVKFDPAPTILGPAGPDSGLE